MPDLSFAMLLSLQAVDAQVIKVRAPAEERSAGASYIDQEKDSTCMRREMVSRGNATSWPTKADTTPKDMEGSTPASPRPLIFA